MQAWFSAVLTINLFFLCINLGLYLVNSAFYPEQANTDRPAIPQYVNFTQLNQTNAAIVDDFGNGGGFNPALIYGDFLKAGSTFLQLISGGYIFQTLQLLGFPSYFTYAFQGVVGVMTVGGLLYLVSGRI